MYICVYLYHQHRKLGGLRREQLREGGCAASRLAARSACLRACKAARATALVLGEQPACLHPDHHLAPHFAHRPTQEEWYDRWGPQQTDAQNGKGHKAEEDPAAGSERAHSSYPNCVLLVWPSLKVVVHCFTCSRGLL